MCWALCLGSRVSLAPAVAGLTLLVLRAVFRTTRWESRERMRLFAAVLIPLALGGALLALYNYVRFDDWREFGVKYQLAWYNIRALNGRIFSVPNVPVALWAYGFKPPAFWPRFPFFLGL